MAGKIPKHFIDDLLSQIDIIDLIQGRIPLKKAGHEYQACCPFHTEKTPSFTVSPKKQFYHCFGCGAHGTAISFMMEYERLNFPEAIEELAARQGLTIPYEANFEQGPNRQPLYDLLGQVADYYAQQLRQHPEAARAVDYLKQRGLTGNIAARYQLGFAPPGWDNVAKKFSQHPKSILQEAGLIKQTDDGKTYDRLRDRIVFPIRDGRGRVIGFGGRLLGDGKPKYLNSPETPIFQKGQQLYGLYEVRQTHRQPEHLIVVEGYMDVIALAQHGIQNAVATLGTATTANHLQKLYRTSKKITYCFDGDRAGREAAWKALQTTLPLMESGRQARFLFLPDGEDPDSLVRNQGVTAWEAEIAQAQPLSTYLYSHLETGLDTNNLDDLAQLAELAKPLLSQLPAGTFRAMMEQQLNKRIGLKTQIPAAKPKPSRPVLRKPRTNTHTMPPVRKAVALVIQHPQAAQSTLPEGWEQLKVPGIETLQQLITQAQHNPENNSAQMVEHITDPKIRQYLAQLAVADLAVQNDAAEQLQGILRNLLETEYRQAHQALFEIPPGQMTAEQKQALRALYQKDTTST